jgi:hypothetical protein
MRHLIRLAATLAVLNGASPEAVADVVVKTPQPRTSITIDVGDYLRLPDGSPQTPYLAFRAALDAAREQKAARVVVPPGRYVFSNPQVARENAHLLVVLQQDLEIDGQGAELVFTNTQAQGIVLAAAERILIRNLSIDWDAHLASSGVVQRRPDGTAAIRIDDKYPVAADVAFESVSEFDVAARRWKGSLTEAYYPRDVRMIAPQTFTSPDFNRFADGAEVIVRHRVYGGNAIGGFMMQLSDITFEDVTVYSAPGMGFYFAATGKGIRLNRCVVKTREGRLISTTADGAHFATTGGQIIVENSDFSGQGDDGISINAHWLQIVDQVDPVTVRLGVIFRARFYPGWIMPGTELVIRDSQSLREQTRRKVRSVIDEPETRTFRVELDAPIDVAQEHSQAIVGTDMMASSNFVVRGNRFSENRGRGMLIMSPNGIVENNVVTRPTMACVNIASDARYFFVGFGVSDLTVRDNLFEGCNGVRERVAPGLNLAAVNVFSDVPSGFGSAPIHRRVTFERNRIIDTPGRALLIASASHIMVRNNTIIDANTIPPMGATEPPCSVFVTRASNVVISGLTEQSTKDTYGKGVSVDHDTTSGVVISPTRQRAARH